MNVKCYITMCLFSIFFLLSCQKQEQEKISGAIVIPVEIEAVEPLDYSDWFTSRTLIPLETNDDCLIRGIDKIYIEDSTIIVFDSKKNEILQFDLSGSFIRNIGTKGNGPDEYLFFNDIFFESNTQLIYAHDRYQNCIFTYDLSGKFIKKTERSRYLFNSFCKTESGFWIYSCFKKPSNPEGYNLMLLDENLDECKAAFFPQEEFFNAVFTSRFTMDNNGNPYFFYPTSNIIYSLKDSIASPYYKVDFGHSTLPYGKITQLSNMDSYDRFYLEKINKNKYLGDIDNFYVHDAFCGFAFAESGLNIVTNSYSCFFNSKNKEISIFSSPFIDAMNFPIMNKPLGIYNNSVVYATYPHIFTEDSFDDLNNELSINITWDSNPILVLLEMK